MPTPTATSEPDPTATPAPTAIPIADSEIAAIAAKTYTGKAIKPAPVVKYGSATLVKGTDYTLSYANNVDAGTATVTVTGIGDYAGSADVPFTINPRKLSKAKVTGIKDATYTGKAIKPAPVVKYGGATLAKGVDYKVKYAANRKIGTATVTITGRGNYAGTVKKTFKISPKAVAVSKLTAGKRSLVVRWAKTAGGAGYQIQCGLKSKYKSAKPITITGNSTVKKVIKELKKGKVYYVRIRGYKKVDGVEYVSAWSAAKHVKVK